MQQVGWYIPQKVIYVNYPSHLDVSTLINLQEQIIEMLNEVESPVYVISNLANIESYPINVNQIKTVVTLIKHPNNIAININHNRAIKFMSSFVPKMLRAQLQLKDVDNMEEAIQYIKLKDSTIDWSLANNNLTDMGALSP